MYYIIMKKLKVKLKLHKGLKQFDLAGQLIAECVASVKEIHNYESLKLDGKLTRCVMKEVLKQSKKHLKDADKSGIVKAILAEVHSLTPDEVVLLDKQIEDILDSGVLERGVFLKGVVSVVRIAKKA